MASLGDAAWIEPAGDYFIVFLRTMTPAKGEGTYYLRRWGPCGPEEVMARMQALRKMSDWRVAHGQSAIDVQDIAPQARKEEGE